MRFAYERGWSVSQPVSSPFTRSFIQVNQPICRVRRANYCPTSSIILPRPPNSKTRNVVRTHCNSGHVLRPAEFGIGASITFFISPLLRIMLAPPRTGLPGSLGKGRTLNEVNFVEIEPRIKQCAGISATRTQGHAISFSGIGTSRNSFAARLMYYLLNSNITLTISRNRRISKYTDTSCQSYHTAKVQNFTASSERMQTLHRP